MQEEFRPLVEEVSLWCKKYFAEKLIAMYLHGSIAMDDAIPYVSDLDCNIVILEELSPEDQQYLEQMENELQQRHVVVNGIHLSVYSVEALAKDKFARFALKYNSMLYYGDDIVKELDDGGCEKFEPNAEMAKGRLAFARKCFEQALNKEQPACTGEIPTDTYYAARKYARYFVIIEGAYFLMSQSKFESFDKWSVLNKLYECTDGFKEELDVTCKILEDPQRAGIKHDDFLKRIRVFVEWMFDRIEKA